MPRLKQARPLIPRALLFSPPERSHTRISPDGRLLSWLAPSDGRMNIWLAPRDTPRDAYPLTRLGADLSADRDIQAYSWSCDGRCLIVPWDADGRENHHILAVDAATGAIRDLTPFDGVAARIVRSSRVLPDHLLIALNLRDRRTHDLHLLELSSGALCPVENQAGGLRYLCDAQYRVILAARTLPDGGSEILRREGGDAWRSWIRFSADDGRHSFPRHLSHDGALLYLQDSRGRETGALRSIALATGAETLLAAHDEVDIGPVLVAPDTLAPLAYGACTDRMRHYALEPSIAGDLDFLQRQDIGDWWLQSRSEDDRLWVIAGSSDTRAARAFLYDRDAGALQVLHEGRPKLAALDLAPMRPLSIRARDGLSLVSYLTLPRDAAAVAGGGPAPLVLLVHGGPWSRDMFGFNVYHQWLADRGYAALSVNFRGSSGFGKTFTNAGDREWGGRMDDDLTDAVTWAIRNGIADEARIAIMGASYGGYAVLSAMARHPTLYACGIDIMGPSDLETFLRHLPPYWQAVRPFLFRAIGDPATEDGARLASERSPIHQAERICRPLLIAHGANDPRVLQAQSDTMADRLRANGVPVITASYADEGHGLVRTENRLAFHAQAEKFLSEHLGGRLEPASPP